MKTWRPVCCMGATAVLIIALLLMCSTAESNHPPRKFMYGVWGDGYDSAHVYHSGLACFNAMEPGSRFPGQMDTLQNILGFNMAHSDVYNHATAESLINRGFKVIEFDSSYHAGKPSDYAWSWYLTWQSDAANIPSWYQGVQDGGYYAFRGRQTTDMVEVDLDTVWVIGNQPGDSPGWVVRTGGCAFKRKPSDVFYSTQRAATFWLKAIGANPSQPVAKIAVTRGYWPLSGGTACDTVFTRTLYGSEFSDAYQPFTVSWPHEDPGGWWGDMWNHYLVYWYGNGTLYFDEVISADNVGSGVAAGEFDPEVIGYANTFTYGTDGSYLLGWYLLDERTTPETAASWRRVDSLLRVGQGHKGGFQQLSWWPDAWSAMHMLKLDYMACINYPSGGSHCDGSTIDDSGAVSFSTDSPGGDSVSLQVAFNDAAARYKQYKQMADSIGAIMWAIPGSFQYFGSCGGICFEKIRRPSGPELLANCNLALAYGADAISFFKWGSDYCYISGIYGGDTLYPSFYHLRDLVSPFIDSLGDRFYDLKWIDAGSGDAVGSITGSFIDSVTSEEFPSAPYVEVAFFEDTTVVAPDYKDYFFLVSRRCLPSETQTVTVYLRNPFPPLMRGVYHNYVYFVDQYTHDSTTVDLADCSLMPELPCPPGFTTSLAPGQGKLFWVGPAEKIDAHFIDSIQYVDGEGSSIGDYPYFDQWGGPYFILETEYDTPREIIVWLNDTLLALGSPETYYIIDETEGDSTIAECLPGTASIPFEHTIPSVAHEQFRVEAACNCGPLWGDLNNDGFITPPDVVVMVRYVYNQIDLRVFPPGFNCPMDVGDWNCDGAKNPPDVVVYVRYVYQSLNLSCPNPCDQ